MPVQKKILVVDNESGMRFLLKERFETLGISRPSSPMKPPGTFPSSFTRHRNRNP